MARRRDTSDARVAFALHPETMRSLTSTNRGSGRKGLTRVATHPLDARHAAHALAGPGEHRGSSSEDDDVVRMETEDEGDVMFVNGRGGRRRAGKPRVVARRGANWSATRARRVRCL